MNIYSLCSVNADRKAVQVADAVLTYVDTFMIIYCEWDQQ